MNGYLTINVSPKFSKANLNNEVPVYLRLTMDGDRIEISLRKRVSAKSWNPQLKQFTGKGSSKINNFIDEETAYIRSIKRDLDIQEEPYTLIDIKNKYFGGSNGKQVFLIERFKEHISELDSLTSVKYSPNTVKNYRVTLKHLKEFVRTVYHVEDVNVKSIDHEFLISFDRFLRIAKNHVHNTAVKNMKRLKKIVSGCKADGLIKANPFHRIKLGYKPGNRDALTETELAKFTNKEFRLEKLNRVKDAFVFICLTGLSYIDLKELKPKNLVETDNGDLILKGNRRKSGEPYVVYLLPLARKILLKYKTHPICVQKGVLLPIISNQKMNDLLKEIAEILEIDKKISCHVGRYTFITTVMAANGISGEISGKAAGQASDRFTAYYTKLDEMSVIKYMKKLEPQYS